ncbi:MAG: terminase [Rikenellaceae bacterium]
MAKKEMEQSKELARLYYLNGDSQKLIAERVGVSRVTIGKWVNDGNWDAIRTAKSVTRKELVAKMMRNASEKLDNKEMSFDEMSKLAATIKELDKQTNVITLLEVFTVYNEWLVARMQVDKELTPELVKTMNRYQDIFLGEQLSRGKITLDFDGE